MVHALHPEQEFPGNAIAGDFMENKGERYGYGSLC